MNNIMPKITLVKDTIDREDVIALAAWLLQDPSPKLTKGNLTWNLEYLWAEKIGTKYSVFVNSGSSAIFLTLAALLQQNNLKNKKIVIPALSWATDLSSPMILNMEPILCDCNLEDLSCDLDHLEEIFKTESPACMILVSVLGLVPQMDKIVELCKKYDVVLLEDVCESMGSKFKGKYLGTFGKASFFSMYFGHHLSTIEGGFINTDDYELYQTLIMMRSHGWIRDLNLNSQDDIREKYSLTEFESMYKFIVPGMNLRSTDLQAFIGLRQLDKFDEVCLKRENTFQIYESLITNNKFSLRNNKEDFISNFAYPILAVYKRDKLVEKLNENKIECRPLIAGNLANHPMWYSSNSIPRLHNCELVNEHGLYIPNHPQLTIEEITKVSSIINEI